MSPGPMPQYRLDTLGVRFAPLFPPVRRRIAQSSCFRVAGGSLTPLTPLTMQDMKPSMFSPGLSDPPAPSYPGLAPSDYYTSSPYTQYSNYPSTVSYSNYGAPSPGGLLSK